VRIAVDTNVLVRYLTWDDPAQAEAAARVVEEAESVFISIVVLCEVVWVLKRGYRYKPEEIADALRGLIESDGVETNRVAVETGLRLLEAGGDFADGVILSETERAGVRRLVTFDTTFAARAGTEVVTLLSATPR